MLQQKDDAKIFEKIVIDATKNKAQVFVWDIIVDEVIKVPVELKNVNTFKKKVYFNLDHRSKFYLKDLIKGPGFLKFFIPSQQLIFVSKVDLYRGTQLEIDYPQAFKKHDRRKSDRFEPLVPVYFKAEGMKKECFDLSRGGLSFILNNMEYSNAGYKKSKNVECSIQFPTRKLKIKAEIVKVTDIKPFEVDRFPYGAKRVSLRIVEGDLYKESVTQLAKGMKKIIIDLL